MSSIDSELRLGVADRNGGLVGKRGLRNPNGPAFGASKTPTQKTVSGQTDVVKPVEGTPGWVYNPELRNFVPIKPT